MWRFRRDGPRELESGDRFAGYHLESLLGEGAMGLVFRAVRNGGDIVALKVLKRELGEDEVFKQRFDQEARAAARSSTRASSRSSRRGRRRGGPIWPSSTRKAGHSRSGWRMTARSVSRRHCGSPDS
jgi:serine/threonine protein kinase